jgi:uncharacterized SAM-binding protein YcdF (DUF218 family)
MIDGLLIKKLVSMFVHIVPGAFLLLLASLVARRWFPRICNSIAVIICTGLIAASLPPVSNYFVAGLENKFPALQQLPEDTGAVLVLGYGHNYAIDRPVNSILTAGALARLTEGVRLWKTRPQSLLVVSGSGYRSSVSHAQVMMETAVTFGVPADKIIRLDHTRDTAEEMRAVNDILQQQAIIEKRLVVVSSATHLPRAEMLIQPLEIPYTMAPTDYLASRYPWYFPGSGSLHHLDRVVHEWMGMLWIKLNRAIQSTS